MRIWRKRDSTRGDKEAPTFDKLEKMSKTLLNMFCRDGMSVGGGSDLMSTSRSRRST